MGPKSSAKQVRTHRINTQGVPSQPRDLASCAHANSFATSASGRIARFRGRGRGMVADPWSLMRTAKAEDNLTTAERAQARFCRMATM